MQHTLIWADYAMLGIIGLSVLASVFRGFVREAFSLASWIAAVVIALLFTDDVANFLTDYVSTPSMRTILAFVGLFVIALFLGGAISTLMGKLVDKTGLTGTDRALGMVFGVMRGVGIVAVLVLLAGLTPLPKDPWWNESVLMPRFVELALFLRDMMPDPYSGYFVLT